MTSLSFHATHWRGCLQEHFNALMLDVDDGRDNVDEDVDDEDNDNNADTDPTTGE